MLALAQAPAYLLPLLNPKPLSLLLQNKDDLWDPPHSASLQLLQPACAHLHHPAFCPFTALGDLPSAIPWRSRLPVPPNYLLAAPGCPGQLHPALLGTHSHGIASCTPLDCKCHMGKDSAVCLGYTFFIDSLLSSFTAP